MKIEMGESLVYSWLRHVKECQLAQTNWKTSSAIWKLHNESELNVMFDEISSDFSNKGKGNLFKKTSTLAQLLKQGECDALGIAVENGVINYYAVDVAFHESGLNYGSKNETILKLKISDHLALFLEEVLRCLLFISTVHFRASQERETGCV